LGVLFILRNSIQGMGYSLLPMLAGVGELIARSLVAIGFVSTIGFAAASLSSPVAWVFADVILIITYAVKLREMKKTMIISKPIQIIS
ncbi:MAG: MATE family efflux transporter, partial [Oscillospiraceae bacterium]|nr:MATE family efflux transporter [Oscillospiraceae bacterium]